MPHPNSSNPLATAGVASPCISLCQMDAASGLCQGCWRTIAEIAAWSGMDDAQKQWVLHLLEPRRSSRLAATESRS